MEIYRIIKSVARPIIVSAAIITIFALTIPELLFIPGILSTILIFSRIYTQGGKDFSSLDYAFLICVLLIGGIAALLQIIGCLFLSTISECQPNHLRANIFITLFFPCLGGVVSWFLTRSPMIIKALWTKWFGKKG